MNNLKSHEHNPVDPSSRPEKSRLIRGASRFIAPLALAAACSSPSPIEAENRSDLTPTTTEQASPTTTPDQVEPGECAINNPFYGKFDDTFPHFEEIGASLENYASSRAIELDPSIDTETILDSIEKIYGVRIEFGDMPVDDDRLTFEPLFGQSLEIDEHMIDRVKRFYIGQFIHGSAVLPPELIKDAPVERLIFARGLSINYKLDVTSDTDVAEIGGIDLSEIGVIIIDVNIASEDENSITLKLVAPTIVHELFHDVDHVFCETDPTTPSTKGDYYKDEAFSNGSSYVGYGNLPPNLRREEFYQPSQSREFATHHSSRTPAEDRATAGEHMLFKRGLILEGDADYGSDYHKKQLELLRRLEEIYPGVAKFLEQITPLIRESNLLAENPNGNDCDEDTICLSTTSVAN